MNIIYKKSALKFLKTTDKSTRENILASIEGLTKIPPEGDIKILQGRKSEYRLRVGKYRIIYELQNDILTLIDIGSRGDIYK